VLLLLLRCCCADFMLELKMKLGTWIVESNGINECNRDFSPTASVRR